MADRYWVGGTGNWDATTTHWSSSSGGASGASVPTSSDNVFVDGNSGSSPLITINGVLATCHNFDCTGSNSATFSSSGAPRLLTVTGNFTLDSNTTFTLGTGLTFTPDAGTTVTINTNGRTVDTGTSPLLFSGGGPVSQRTVNLASAITHTGGAAFRFTIANLTFNTNDFNIICSQFQDTSSSNANIINLGNSTITIGGTTNAWIAASTTTLNSGTSLLSFSNGTADFGGASKTYYNVTFHASATITGCNTFNVLTIFPGSTITFPGSSCVQTIGLLNAVGTAASHIIFTRSGSGAAIISAGTAITDYIDVSNNTASGSGSPFYDPNGTDGGGNTNWIFSQRPARASAMLLMDT